MTSIARLALQYLKQRPGRAGLVLLGWGAAGAVATALLSLSAALAPSGGLPGVYAAAGAFPLAAAAVFGIGATLLLVEDRRRDLATLRTLGADRGRLALLHGLEALAYAAVSAGLGAAGGRYLAATLLARLTRVPDFRHLTPSPVDPAALVLALLALTAGIAVLAALVAGHATGGSIAQGLRQEASWSASEPPRRIRGLLPLAGLLLTVYALRGGDPAVTVAGPILLAWGLALWPRAAPLRRRAARLALPATVLYLLALWLWGGESSLSLFAAQGILLALSGGLLLAHTPLAPALAGALEGSRRALPAVLALRFAHGDRRRAAPVLAMVAAAALASATLGVLAASTLGEVQAGAGGFDLLADVPGEAASPVPDPRVEAWVALPLSPRAADRFTVEEHPLLGVNGFTHWKDAVGVTPALVVHGRFHAVRLGAPSAQEALALVAADPHAIVVADTVHAQGADRPIPIQPGDVVAIRTGNATLPATVRAVLRESTVAGFFVHPSIVAGLGQPPATRVLVSATGSPAALAAEPLSGFVPIEQLDAERGEGLAAQLEVLQAFLLVTLLTAACGVALTTARNVAARQRSVSTLRALGLRGGEVAAVFVLEAGYLGLLGVAGGTGAGILAGWSFRSAQAGADLPFVEIPLAQTVLFATVFVAVVMGAAFPLAHRLAAQPAAAGLRGGD